MPILMVVACWLTPTAHGVEMTTLYTVEVPLDPDDPDARSNAYRAALTEVLVRVTGTTAAAQSEELALLFPNPARFVRQYRPGNDDTLMVTLDGEAIERVLRQSGATVWGPDRPLTIVWLAVDWGSGEREIIGADDPDRLPGSARSIDRNRQLRERVQAIATRRGVPIVFPLLDTEDLQNIGFGDIWGGFDDQLLDASARYDAASVLVGRIRPGTMQPSRWTWYLGGQRYAWPGEPEEAVNQLADALAARLAIRGDQELETIELTISGINSVVAYGQVQRYLENLRVVDKLMVKSVASDRITYEVEIQGGIDRLDSALKLATLLERVDRTYAIDGSSFGIDERPFGLDRPTGARRQVLQYAYRSNGTAGPGPNPGT